MEYQKLPKNALYCMYAAEIAELLIVAAIAGAVNYFWLFPKDIAVGKWISLIIVAYSALDACISPYFRYRRYHYSINEECIDIVEGWLFVKRSIVPIERLHKLETSKGPLDRIFGVANVIVTTAGGDVKIAFLEDKKAEEIAGSLRKRINEIVVRQREKDGKGEEI